MPTLSEYQKLSNDIVKSGIMLNIITANMLMPFLQFTPAGATAYVYNRESTLPTTTTFAMGSTLANTEPTFTKKTATLSRFYVQSPLDKFALQTLSDVQSQESVLISSMAKSYARKMAQMVIQGEPESVTTEPEGLDSLVRSETRMMAMDDGNLDGPGSAETELTLDRLDAMIDLVMDGQVKPHALIMNTTMRRKLTSLSRASGSGVVMSSIEMFGHKITTYDGIPILINNWITDEETYNDSSTWPSSTATTIYAVIFGEENQGLTIIHSGDAFVPRVEDLGTSKTADEKEYRMVGYWNQIVYSAKTIAALGGIDSSA